MSQMQMDADAYGDGSPDEGGGGLPGFLMDPVGVLKRRWKLMVVVGFLGVTASVAAFFVMPQTYTARATVVVSSQRISEEFFQSTVAGDQIEKISVIVGELLSRQHVAKIIETFELYRASKEGSNEISMQDKVRMFRSNVSIAPEATARTSRRNETSVLYIIEFTSSLPMTSAGVANTLAKDFTEAHLRMRSRQAKLTTNFLQAELKQAENALIGHERAITEYKQRYRGELPGELQTNLARLDRLQQQRQSLALQIAEAETRLASLAGDRGVIDPESPSGRLIVLRKRYLDLSAVYTRDHPNAVSLDRQIRQLESEIGIPHGAPIESTPFGAAGTARLTLAELRKQLDETVANFEELDARVARIPERAEALVTLEQRAKISRENHQEFLRKVSQAELAEAVESAQQGERAMVLDTAIPPNQPDRSRETLLGMGLVMAIGLAGASGLLWEILDSVIVDPGEIEHEFHLPVLGSVSRIS